MQEEQQQQQPQTAPVAPQAQVTPPETKLTKKKQKQVVENNDSNPPTQSDLMDKHWMEFLVYCRENIVDRRVGGWQFDDGAEPTSDNFWMWFVEHKLIDYTEL